MPKITTTRNDVIRNHELDRMLKKVEAGTTNYGKQPLKFNPDMIKCLLALLWIFGKRISEILKVRRGDIFTRKGYLYVRFTVLKKRGLKERPIPEKRLKRITLQNPYAKLIINWTNRFERAGSYIFPGRVRERTFNVVKKETGKVYTYHQDAEPRMSRELAYKILKGINPKVWLHLFRSSVATEMAERGATEEQLMAWFDWDRYDTAHEYVKGGPKLTAKWAKRTW